MQNNEQKDKHVKQDEILTDIEKKNTEGENPVISMDDYRKGDTVSKSLKNIPSDEQLTERDTDEDE